MLNSRGGIECDLTVTRLGKQHYYIVTGTGFRTHDFHWIKDHLPRGDQVTLIDVTEDHGTLVLMGPKARDILAAVTGDPVDNARFPFATARVLTIAGHNVRALRVTYVGELGWELHVPMAGVETVYDALMAAGGPVGLKLAGYRALESLRLEKGYRAWSSDITPNDTPFEAGLGWAVKLKSERNFMGRAALEQKANQALRKMLVSFTT